MLPNDNADFKLGEDQLAKLTNESSEIRMRALQEIETRFIRGLRLGKPIIFKPLLFFKQLIRWFGFTPILATDRVLSLLLELVRSNYGNVVVRKITYERLCIELQKVMNILRSIEEKRAINLLEDLRSLVLKKYKVQPESAEITDLSSNNSNIGKNVGFHLMVEFSHEDYECAWTRASLDDIETMKSFVDVLVVRGASDSELEVHLTNLQIKMLDYPPEFFLQTPHIFLQLLQVQKKQDTDTILLHANRALLAYVRQLQQRIVIRQNILSHVDIENLPETHPMQLRVPIAMGLLLSSCIELVDPFLFLSTSRNWHLLELLVETIRTFDMVNAPVSQLCTEKLGLMVRRLISYCHDLKHTDMPQLIENLVMPRLRSAVLSGLLQDAVTLNFKHSKEIDRKKARHLIQPIVTDSSYLSCVPDRNKSLNNLNSSLSSQAAPIEQKVLQLKRGYSLALSQLRDSTKLTGSRLLRVQRQICFVITQIASKTLVKQLFDSVIECTAFFGTDLPLRKEAESLLSTLLDLPNENLQSVVFRLMARPVVEHFHAFVNKSNYLSACNNLELVREHILGLPLNSMLLRKLLYYSWTPKAPAHVRQCCVDYLTMLLKLYGVLSEQDFQIVCHLIFPAVPLMVCRSVSQEQLHQVLWHMFEPDSNCFETLQMLRGNLCYMFHPNLQLRKNATARIVYTLQCQDYMHIYKPTINNLSKNIFDQDLCLVQPPLPYTSIFVKSMLDSFQQNRSVDALLGLLQTTDLRESIRRSTLVQINVLLQNWETVDYFTKHDASYRQVLDALHDVLKKSSNADLLETLLPVVSIFLKLLCHTADFRREMSNSLDVHFWLLRVLLLLPHETELRRNASVCLFLMLFHEHITTNQFSIVLDVDLDDLLLPIICELNTAMAPTPADEGLALEKELLDKQFGGNANLAAQHWRFYVAHQLCKSPSNRTLILVQNLDIRDTLKLKMEDLALLKASHAHAQLHRHLFKVSNCSDYHYLEQIVGRLQSFLVLLRNEVVQDDFTNLWSLIYKYIRLVPGNSADHRLFELLLELCLSCVRFENVDVFNGLTKSLGTDPNHPFLKHLKDRSTRLDWVHLICQCLIYILESPHNKKVTVSPHDVQDFHCTYFKELSILARQHLELRQLEHVRCLLRVLRCLSDHTLYLSEAEVKYFAQHFVQLSSDMRTLAQTGSQLQRDCLHILAQIQPRNLPLEKVLRYLLSLCGHNDGEVRALAWVSLANCISNGIYQDIVSVLPRMDYLPGGLAACCLTTMLDVHELMMVRTLAGRVFIELITHIGPDLAIELLHRHDFLKDAFLALKCLKFDSTETVTNCLDGQQSSCAEVISCYIAICLRIVKLLPPWAAILCDHAFINALSAVFKMLPLPPMTPSRPHIELCSVYICDVYCMMYKDNFGYLQRTVCRDLTFLESYLRLFNKVLDLECPERMLVHILKMFLVLSKDDNACLFLFDELKKQQNLLLDIFLYGLHLSYRKCQLQRYTLSVISVVLIKTQTVSAHINLVAELESCVLPLDELLSSDDEEFEITGPVLIASKENNRNTLNRKMVTSSAQVEKVKADQESGVYRDATGVNCTNAAVLLYYRLDRLFEYYFPVKTYNFLNPPGMGHVQVCVAIGGMLKLSPWAVYAARQLKLQDRVFSLFEAFLNDINIGNANGYVRRVGAHKCKNILSNLLVLLNMMTKWHSSVYAVITEPAVAVNAVHLLIRIWPWLSHSSLLKQLTVQLVMFLTEHSFEMCKHTSLVLPGQSHSLLQLIIRVADHETTRRETLQKDDSTPPNSNLMPALRIMMNCCSCSDGRLALSKMHVLDMFDTILPAIHTHVPKIRQHVLISWLGFWECYSRYDAGAKPCHLHGLLHAVRCFPPMHPVRLLCLGICRNMCFLNGNRSHFVNFVDFLDLLHDVIVEPVDIGELGEVNTSDLFEEHRLVVLILWKLFGFGAKYKAMIRGTKILKHLRILREQLDNMKKKFPGKFQQLKHAESVNDLLEHLFKSLQ